MAGESAQGMLFPIVVAWFLWHRAVVPTVSARGAVGSWITSRLARSGDHDEAEG